MIPPGPLQRAKPQLMGNKIVAETATARVQGRVLRAETRSGMSKTSGEPYSMVIVHTLVADQGITELVLPREWSAPVVGGELDVLVEFNVRNGRLGASILQGGVVPASK